MIVETHGGGVFVLVKKDILSMEMPELSLSVGPGSDSAIQQELIDLSSRFNLTQMQETPTRQDNVLDLVFTTNPSLVKNVTTTPGSLRP